MRKITLTVLFIICQTLFCYGQSIDSLVKEGIQFHDNGNFTEAINVYKKALDIDPNSSLVNYEIALSYISNQEYKKAEEHSLKVIDQNNEHLLEAYVALGNSLDLQGKPKQAIKAYEKGLKKFDHYLLHYNHAIACFNIGQIDDAYDSAINSIMNNSGHASSHLILSKIMDKKNSRIKAMLPLYFFLLIEPNSDRAAIEYDVLRNYLDYGVTRESEKNINVSVPFGGNDGFGAAEMMVSLVKSSETLEENKGKSDLELFALHNDKIFKILGELKKENTGFWWDFYVPFFYDLSTEGYSETYSYYISITEGDSAIKWLENNETNFNSFTNWLSE